MNEPLLNANAKVTGYMQVLPFGAWTVGKVLALEPFPTMSIEKDTRSGFTTIRQKATLTGLRVVFPSEDNRFLAGDTVFVMADNYAQPFAKNVYEQEGKKFILCPEALIQLVRRGT